MKYAVALMSAAQAVRVNQLDRLDYEDDFHLGDFDHGRGFDDLHFLDIDYGYGRQGLDVYDLGYGYGPQIVYDGNDHGVLGGYGNDPYYASYDHEYRYLDFYSNDSHSYSDSPYDSRDSQQTSSSHDASTSHHTSDSDFTDFSNGTFSDDGYHNHPHDGFISYASGQDNYTLSDDFQISSHSDGPDGHSHGYFSDNYTHSDSSGYQEYYTDGHSYDSFSDGHFGPDGHYGHGIYGDFHGVDHFHGAAFNGHDYGNVDEFINGGALAFGANFGYNVEELGYRQDHDYIPPHSYDAYRPVHHTYTGIAGYTRPNYPHYDYDSPLSKYY